MARFPRHAARTAGRTSRHVPHSSSEPRSSPGPSHRLSRRGLQQVPAGAQRPAQTPSYSGPKQVSRSRWSTTNIVADGSDKSGEASADYGSYRSRPWTRPGSPAGQIGLSIVRGHLRANNPPSRTRRPAQRQPRSCLRPAAAPDRHPVLTEPSVRRLRMNPIHPGPLGQFHTLMQTHVRSRRLTTLRTVANPLPWRKPRWFDQRYEFGHWGGHIESARSGRSGARSRRRPIRGRSARPRG